MQILEIHVTEPKDKPYVEVYVDYGWATTTFNIDKKKNYDERHYIAEALPAIRVWLGGL